MGKRIAVALAMLGATALILFLYLPGAGPSLPSPQTQGTAAIGGPFTLTASTGRAVTEAELLGHPSLVYFGFTHCPDICPLSLQAMTRAIEDAGPAGDKVQPVFITIDPERDTADAMTSYIASFHSRFWALTGTPEQVRAAEKSYKVFAEKAPLKDAAGNPTGDYTMNHTGFIYLMDGRGQYLDHFDKDATAAQITARLKQL